MAARHGRGTGASVFVDRGRRPFAKVVPRERITELATERDRTTWLNHTGIPSPGVLDWRESDHGACLVTHAMGGVPACELDHSTLQRAWPSVVAIVRELHELETERCPFDRGVAHMMALAEATVAEDRVVVPFLPAGLQRTRPAQILEEIRTELPRRAEEEFATVYGEDVDPERIDFYLRLDPLTW